MRGRLLLAAARCTLRRYHPDPLAVNYILGRLCHYIALHHLSRSDIRQQSENSRRRVPGRMFRDDENGTDECTASFALTTKAVPSASYHVNECKCIRVPTSTHSTHLEELSAWLASATSIMVVVLLLLLLSQSFLAC